tara:strand:- start:27204 stop:27629 length:426 start_codon:yes stop_codon:yes gene_type:complete
MIKLDLKPAPHIIKQFAWFAVIGMGLLAFAVLKFTVGFSWDHPAFLICVGIGVLQLVLFLAGITVLSRVLFVALSVAFVPIGFVISHVLMAVVYYLVLTPIALVFRVMGRDVIGKKLDKDAKTYWHERSGDRPAASYFKLY